MRSLLLLLLLPFSLPAQPRYDGSRISTETRKAAEHLGTYSTFYSSQISPSAGTTGAWGSFGMLEHTATIDELKMLSWHPQPVVRCYAFLAVAYRDSSSVLPLLIEHLTDTQQVSTRIGCFDGRQEAGDLMYDLVVNSGMQWGNYKLGNKEVAQLDSVILHHPGRIIPVKEAALARVDGGMAHYTVVRAAAVAGDKKAIIALASYHNLDDTALILSLLPPPDCDRRNDGYNDYFTGSACFVYDFCNAVRRWPAPFFLPKLKRFMHGHYWEQGSMIPLLWYAFAAYRTPEAVALLCDEADYFVRHPNPIFSMYDMHFIVDEYGDDPVFRPLAALHSQYADAQFPLVNLLSLIRNRPQLAWEVAKFYMDSIRCRTAYYFFDSKDAEKLAPELLDIGLQVEHDRAIAFINRTLKYQQHDIGSVLCEKIGTLNEPAFNPGLLSYIRKDEWLYECLGAATILLRQGDPALSQQVVEASRANPTSLTWESWRPKFDELFTQYGVKH